MRGLLIILLSLLKTTLLNNFCISQEAGKMTASNKNHTDQFLFTQIAQDLNFPEGPAWDGINSLYVSNCSGDRIIKIGQQGVETFLTASKTPFTFEKTNGLTVFKDGSLFACEFGRGAILKINMAGDSEIYASGFQGKPFNRPNDLAFDPVGNLYFSDPKSYDPENPDGIIYLIKAGSRQVVEAAKNLAFPNGLTFAADGNSLFVCESAKHRVLKFKVDKKGSLLNPVVFAEMPGGDPDGCNLDVEDNLYVAHFGGGAIYVFTPDGAAKNKIATPGLKPSNLEFGDDDMRTLYITEDESNAVYKTRVKIPGLKLFSSPEKNG